MGDSRPVQAILFCIYSAIGRFFSAFTLKTLLAAPGIKSKLQIPIMWLDAAHSANNQFCSAISFGGFKVEHPATFSICQIRGS
jgi:hypothetical protein